MKTIAPLIGLTTYATNERLDFTLPTNYVHAVRRAGGIPLLIPPGETRLEEVLNILDGVILTGGGDIDPQLYGGSEHETIYMVDSDRDRMELEFAKQILRREIPTLAICRGTQVINVAQGGTLFAHLPDFFGDEIAHRAPPREPILHDVAVDSTTRLSEILNVEITNAMSWHHQAIDQLGEGLSITARAPDGVIEAIESNSHRWLIGVQWHPEITAEIDPVQQRLFDALVREIRL